MKQPLSPFQWIIDEYPETMSMEQMRIVCHIAKHTAAHLLQHGLVPCKISPKKTRRYTIKTVDVVYYLKRRELFPEEYAPPYDWYGSKSREFAARRKRHQHCETQRALQAFAPTFLAQQEDVLNTREVSAITGYSIDRVLIWCNSGALYHFRIGGVVHIPTQSLLAFIQQEDFIEILPTSTMWSAFTTLK